MPPLVTDINLSVDDQFLCVSCWAPASSSSTTSATRRTADGGLSLDEKFFPHGEAWRGLRVHQVRLGGGDASSDSYCYRS